MKELALSHFMPSGTTLVEGNLAYLTKLYMLTL